VAGELCIGGDGLARGYLNRPEVTSEKFIPDPFSAQSGARLYKTGDLCRYLPDGNIEFLGRLDLQVKIRGFRIELGEIESALAAHPEVSATAVVVREDTPGEKRLVACFVPRHPASPPPWKSLRDFLKEKLPNHMVPSDFMALKALPLTPNGKVDRRALPIGAKSHQVENRYVLPRDNQEKQLVRIWEEILNVQPVGIEDDFFELGGHSLLAVRMMDRVADAYGLSLPLSALFAEATIKHLAECLRNEGLREIRPAIVPVQPLGSRLPFFFLHGDFLGGFYCRKLARLIGPEQPFYAVGPNGFDGMPSLPTVEAMAEENVRQLVALQPHGPYLLGGYCNGGLVAYEMAHQMEQQGLTVGLVILLDAAVPRYFGWLKALVRGVGGIARLGADTQTRIYVRLQKDLVRTHSGYHRGLKALRTSFLQAARKRFLWVRGTLSEKLGSQAPVPPDPSKRQQQFEFVLSDYRPQPYAGHMVLLRTQSLDISHPTDRTAGWGKVTSQLEIHELPGNHATCQTEHLDIVAEHIGRSLLAYHANAQETLA
jgi:thioesterase domain-containing protein/acyl carrier protein